MSRREEQRKPFYKRPPPPPLPLSKPYTTLSQPASERLQAQTRGVTVQPLVHQQTRYVSEGLGNLAEEFNNVANKARLAQEAAEIVQAAETSEQLKADLEALRLNEIKNIDQQIEDELARRGITKQELQNNPKLRKTVNEWKRKIYRDLNVNLEKSEKEIVAKTQESLILTQQKSREELSKNIVEYEKTLASDIASNAALQQEAYNEAIMAQRQAIEAQKLQIMKDAGFEGTWEEFEKDVRTKDYIAGMLKNSGIITQTENELKLTKPIEQLSNAQITGLQRLGFDITTQQRDEIIKTMADANWTGSWEDFQKDVRVKNYLAGMLANAGTITKADGILTLTKPIERLTDNDLKALNQIGFSITSQQRNDAINYTKSIDSLTSSGIIQKSGEDIILIKPIENITREEITKLNNVGFNITQQDVENAIIQASGMQFSSLSAIGAAFKKATESSRTGENLTGVTTFTPTQIANQNQIFKTALDNKDITPEEYNKAIFQQNANIKAINSLASGLVSSGVLKQVEMVGPLQVGQTRPTSYQLNVPLALVSDKDLDSLKKVGFEITPEMESQRVDTKKLISGNVIKISGNKVTLEKPIETLSDSEIERLRRVGFEIPDLPKGPEQYIAEYAAGLPTAKISGQRTFMEFLPGGEGYVKQELPKFAAVIGDVLRTLAAPIQLVEAFIPGTQPLEGGWRGPTSATLKYYQGLTPTEQIAVSGTGFMASALAGYLEFLPIGFMAKAIPSFARGLTTKIVSASPTLASAKTSLAIGIKNIATTLKLTGSAAIKTLPIESATLKQLSSAMAVLLKNPKFQQAIVWGSMAGLNAYEVYKEIASGKPIDDVIARASTSIAGQIGAFKGFQSGYDIATKKFSDMSKLVRLTGGEVKVTPKGEIETSFTQMKNVPKQLKDLYALELDQMTGKVKVVGFIVKEGGKTSTIPISDVFTQPVIREYSAEAFNKLMTSGKVGLTNAQFNKLTLKQLFDKVILNKKLDIYEVRTILAKYLGSDGLNQLEFGLLKSGGRELLSMTPKELQTVMYKELGYGSLWTKPLQDLKGIPLQGAGRYEYIAAIIDDAKVKIPPEVQKIVNNLKAMGFDNVEASYWTSQILTKGPEQVASEMATLVKGAVYQQNLADLLKSASASATSGSTTTAQILRSAGLNDNQVQNVIKATALSQGDPKTFITTLKNLDPKSATVTLQMLSNDMFASTIIQVPMKPLTFIVESAATSGSLATAGAIMTIVAPKVAADIVDEISPEVARVVAPQLSAQVVKLALPNADSKTVSAIIPNLTPTTLSSVLPSMSSADSKTISAVFIAMTPEQINSVIPNIAPKDFSAIFPKITPEGLTRLVPYLSPAQFNSIIPRLTPETLNSVFEGLTTDQFTAIMQRLHVTPETVLQYIQDLPLPVPTGEISIPIPPGIMKPIVDSYIKRNKKVLEKQESGVYDVQLLYYSSSEKYKITAKSFQGATYDALSRRKTQEVPSGVVVTKAK